MAPKKILTTVQTVPAGGPYIQFESIFDVTRSGDGKQIGLTHRLNSNGVSNRISETSSSIATKIKHFFPIFFGEIC